MSFALATPAPARPWRLSFPTRRFASTVALLLAWEAASRAGLIAPRTLAPPSAVAATFTRLMLSGTLEHHLMISLGRVVTGTAIAVVLGVALALTAGLSRLGEDVLDLPVQMLRTLPHLALVPLFILWLGIGETPKVVLVALGAFFPIYLTLFAGIRGIDPRLLEMTRVLGLSRLATIREAVLPGALPSLLVGLRYGLSMAWLSLVVGEQINASSGIGFMMMDAREFLRTDIIVVGLAVYALLGMATDQAVRWMERRMLCWRPEILRREA